MVLKKMALFVLWPIATFCMLTAIIGPVVTYFAWQRATYLHKLHSEGIETAARVSSGHVKYEMGGGKLTSVQIDLDWSDKQGRTHKAANVNTSDIYGKTLVSASFDASGLQFRQYNLTVTVVPIKYLSTDPQQFILVADSRNSDKDADEFFRGAVIGSLIGVIGLPVYIMLVRAQRRQKRNPQAVTLGQAVADEASTINAMWLLSSVLIYAGLVSLHFTKDGYAMDIKAFGATPFGQPVILVVIAIGTILFLPVFWMLRHFTRIMKQANKDHGALSRWHLVYYICTGGGHTHLRGSRNAVLLGGLYIFALCAAWITYTGIKHI